MRPTDPAPGGDRALARILLSAAYAGAQLAIAKHRLHLIVDAEDAAAEAALHLCERWGRFVAVDNPPAYAAACGRTTAISLARREFARRRAAQRAAEFAGKGGEEVSIAWSEAEAAIQARQVLALTREHLGSGPAAALEAVLSEAMRDLGGPASPPTSWPSPDARRKALARASTALLALADGRPAACAGQKRRTTRPIGHA